MVDIMKWNTNGGTNLKKLFVLSLMMFVMSGIGVHAEQGLPGDVSQSHWVYESVKTASSDGWLELDSRGNFKPETAASRQTVAKLLTEAWAIAGKQGRTTSTLPASSAFKQTFSDLGQADPKAQEALKRLAAAGVISGYPDGTINPKGTISRLELAVILSKVCRDTGARPRVFTDQARIPSWGKTAAEKTAAMGLISGYKDGTFRPMQTVTHAEALQMISMWAYPKKTETVVSRSQSAAAVDPMTADILRLVNVERAKKGLSPLRSDQTLTKVALIKASAMAKGNYFAHVSPEGEGVEALFTRIGVVNWKALGENLLRMKGNVTAESAVAAWMASDAHRAIILTPYTHTGIGFARAADGTSYISEAFATF